jgi:serine/threonine protein kinase
VSALNHPHICALYDVGRYGDQPFIVMELLEGTTLRRRIGGAPLPTENFIDNRRPGRRRSSTTRIRSASSIADIKSANIFINDRAR